MHRHVESLAGEAKSVHRKTSWRRRPERPSSVAPARKGAGLRCDVMWRASEEEHTTRFGSGQPRLSDLMVGGISTPTTTTLSWVRSLSKACLHPAYSMCHPSLAGPTAAALDVDWALLDLGRDVAVGEAGEIPCLPVSAVSA